MKRYCKTADIYDLNAATGAVLRCLAKASTRKRRDTVRLFARVGNIPEEEAALLLRWRGREYERLARLVAEELLTAYRAGRLRLRTVRLKYMPDGSSGKIRAVAMVPVWQLMLDHTACAQLADILRRVGFYQFSGLPGRGTVRGMQKLSKWLQNPAMKYIAQLDITKCYQSIDRGRLMAWLASKVRNVTLLRFVGDLINTSPTPGLCLGSYLSQNLAALYLSELYHEITERMAKMRRSKRRGGAVRVNLVKHCIFYMDDIYLVGTSKKDLHAAVKLTRQKAAAMGLLIKSTWRVLRVRESSGRGVVLDAMGFKISRDSVTVRRRVFRRARRTVLRITRRAAQGRLPALTQARNLISYAGFFKHSNSGYFSRKYNLPAAVAAAKQTISNHDKKHASALQ